MKATTKHELISNPKNIICIGLNYADHIAETSLATHDFPEIFMKMRLQVIKIQLPSKMNPFIMITKGS